jgi:dihydrofolate reductase
MIILIAAIAENNALGKDNRLLWHLPDDFRRFKQLTTGHHIIMGRKTFESFPKPLPNRTHVVITRQKNYRPDGCVVVDSIAKALEISPKDQDVFVIGGGEIYNLALPLADKLDVTKVHTTLDADTFFPDIDPKIWKLEAEDFHPKDERHEYNFTFQTFIRK